MRVAVAGTGAFAKYFTDEFPAAGHEVVVLTRSHKGFLDGKTGVVEQRVTDYKTVSELVEVLKDCDALSLKKALKEQNDVEYTFVSLGWVADYIVPSSNRYHGDIGPFHPLDLHTRTMTIPGTGNDVFSLTSARDAAKAIAELLKKKVKRDHAEHFPRVHLRTAKELLEAVKQDPKNLWFYCHEQAS
eukprot:jgi/Phyca11/20397/fgenesh1_pg.PHYCAscaffold_63_\